MSHFSIHTRLTLATSLLLILFLSVTAWVLDQALQQRLMSSLKNEVQAQVYGFLSAMNENDEGQLMVSDSQFDPRFLQPDSGFYAVLVGDNDQWRSDSLLGSQWDFIKAGTLGEWRYQVSEHHLSLNLTFAWEQFDHTEVEYTLAVAQSLKPMQQAQYAFRQTLLWSLGGFIGVLLLVQWGLLVWGLHPLRDLAKQLLDIQTGKETSLKGQYPQELQALTQNINGLIEHNQRLQHRYKDSLGNLAHSLKTPLAVLQSLSDADDHSRLQQELKIQLPQLDQLIAYQLKTAACQPSSHPLGRVDASALTERIIHSLDKVYRDKHIDCHLDMSHPVYFQGDQGDWMEMAGNLLDNAFKYGHSTVRVSLQSQASELRLSIEDDGAGIDPSDYETIMTRGQRLDEQVQGQGIGLSVVHQLVQSYRGRLVLDSGSMGGLKVSLYLP